MALRKASCSLGESLSRTRARGLAAPSSHSPTRAAWAGMTWTIVRRRSAGSGCQHLRSADFFDIATHPDLTFTADGVSPADEGVRVTGRLTVRGRTRPASFDTKVSTAEGEVWLDGELRVNRADFGLTWNRMGIASMDNTIVVHAVFTRQ